MSSSTARVGRPPADLSPATLDEILDAALRMFSDKGYDGASVAALNRELGVSHNLIHQRFGSKEKLWTAAVDRAFDKVAQVLQPELADTTGGPIEQLRRVIVRFIVYNASHPEILRLTTVEGVASTPRLDYIYDRHIEPLLTAVVEPLDQLIEAGVIGPVSVPTLYFLIAHGGSAPHALIGLSRRLGQDDPLDPQNVVDHANIIADVIIGGTLNRKRT
ncbi:TetR/AcrR family transcriptional regulator [Nocardia sp. NPDC055002]